MYVCGVDSTLGALMKFYVLSVYSGLYRWNLQKGADAIHANKLQQNGLVARHENCI